MIVPCIDLVGGRAVQLIGGEAEAIDGGDPRPIASAFGVVGEIAVVDIDAARGEGSNTRVIEELLERAECRVGGGIRSASAAVRWLDAGASRVVLGTAARPEVLCDLPKDRVIAALDARHGKIVVDGWRTETGVPLLERIAELRDQVGGFLVTQVEREGRMVGADLDLARSVRGAAGDVPVTFAGGIRDAGEIRELDALGLDAQVGMAIYRGDLDLADAFAAPLRSDRGDGLWPTVVVDEGERALGLCWSSARSLRAAVGQRKGIYESRRRGLWVKGESSGDTQELIRVEADCDRDALRFVVRQAGSGFCHLRRESCWGEARGLARLAKTVAERTGKLTPGSYTQRLLQDPGLLRDKLIEEAGELGEAASAEEAVLELADVLYFATVALAQRGGTWSEVERTLDRRSRRITRRPGDAKERQS